MQRENWEFETHRAAILLTGHKSRAIFDRDTIIHEQELLDAGDQLVAYLAQQTQAAPARGGGGRTPPGCAGLIFSARQISIADGSERDLERFGRVPRPIEGDAFPVD